MIVLEDEDGNISETKFLAEKTGLSGGWRGFSITHKLVESDVLVFHLVTPFKFKVIVWTLSCNLSMRIRFVFLLFVSLSISFNVDLLAIGLNYAA